jgi:hypothetical protein
MLVVFMLILIQELITHLASPLKTQHMGDVSKVTPSALGFQVNTRPKVLE